MKKIAWTLNATVMAFTLILITYSSLDAMNQDQAPLVWKPSSATSNCDEQRSKAPLKIRCLKNKKLILGSTLAMLIIAGFFYTIYHYYDILDTTCLKMESACDTATTQLPKVEKSFEPFLDFIKDFKTVLEMFKNCPNATKEFMPKLLKYSQQCCSEQP